MELDFKELDRLRAMALNARWSVEHTKKKLEQLNAEALRAALEYQNALNAQIARAAA